MTYLDLLNLVIAAVALILSVWAMYLSIRTRKNDSFARLYEEINATSFGAAMERIGEWTRTVPSQGAERGKPDEADIRRAYRQHLESLGGTNTKDDPLEGARRSVKAWFIKCLLFREARDLSDAQLEALITADRANLMLHVIAMTREQTAFWKGQPHDPTSRVSSDEPYFDRLTRIAATTQRSKS